MTTTNEQIFGWWGGLPHPPSRENPIYIYIYIYYTDTYTYIKEFCQQIFIYNEEVPCTSHTCAKEANLLLQDLSTLCVTDIYDIYFHLSVSVRNTINLSRHEQF